MKYTNDIIKMATSERKKSNTSGHEGNASYNQPLGYHVFTVFDAAVSGEYYLPYSEGIESANDISTIRNYINENAKRIEED